MRKIIAKDNKYLHPFYFISVRERIHVEYQLYHNFRIEYNFSFSVLILYIFLYYHPYGVIVYIWISYKFRMFSKPIIKWQFKHDVLIIFIRSYLIFFFFRNLALVCSWRMDQTDSLSLCNKLKWFKYSCS